MSVLRWSGGGGVTKCRSHGGVVSGGGVKYRCPVEWCRWSSSLVEWCRWSGGISVSRWNGVRCSPEDLVSGGVVSVEY